jgi:hypothetical protein
LLQRANIGGVVVHRVLLLVPVSETVA